MLIMISCEPSVRNSNLTVYLREILDYNIISETKRGRFIEL